MREHLRNNREIRFPGYLLHQCSSLAETVKDLNIFYTAVLAHGVVPNYTSEYVEQEINRRFGAAQRQGGFKSYIPYDLQLPALRVVAEKNKQQSSIFERFLREDKSVQLAEVNDIAHEALYLLSEELIANEELEFKLQQKILATKGQKLLIESA